MTGRLEGRVAIITGAAHGIGREYALAFARHGAAVAILDLDQAAASAVAEELVAAGGSALGVGFDVSDEARVAEAVGATLDHFGRIDILINNAAMFSVVGMSRVGFLELTVAEWDRMMAINLRGTWLMCRAVAPHMIERGSGKIVNVSSSSALIGTRTQPHYVASKAGILGLTRNLARELGASGITVNCLAPGSTLSEEDPSEETLQLRRGAVASRAIPRLQVPNDLVGAALFLAGSESDFLTGQTLVVDGGGYLH